MVTESQIQRFRTRITYTDSGCWIHGGSRGSHGYAQFGSPKGPGGGLAHRFAWIVANGREIPDRMLVLHSCNVKTCVNPEHLRIGTNDENMDDVARGRYHPRRKLRTGDVGRIRERLAAHESLERIARDFGVDSRVIALIRDGKTYRYD